MNSFGKTHKLKGSLTPTTSPIDENAEVDPTPIHIEITDLDDTESTNRTLTESRTESKTQESPRVAAHKRLNAHRKIAPLFKAKLRYKPAKQWMKSPSFKKRFVVIDTHVSIFVTYTIFFLFSCFMLRL